MCVCYMKGDDPLNGRHDTHTNICAHTHTQIDIQLHLPFSFNYVCESMSVLDESAVLSTKEKVKGREGR